MQIYGFLCARDNVSCHSSVMASFSTKESLQEFTERLGKISRKLAEDLEVEELILYPHVKEKIQKQGLRYYMGTPTQQSAKRTSMTLKSKILRLERVKTTDFLESTPV